MVTPAARRERWLHEFEHSGMSGAKFAQLSGLKYSTFACWLQHAGQAALVAALVRAWEKAAPAC